MGSVCVRLLMGNAYFVSAQPCNQTHARSLLSHWLNGQTTPFSTVWSLKRNANQTCGFAPASLKSGQDQGWGCGWVGLGRETAAFRQSVGPKGRERGSGSSRACLRDGAANRAILTLWGFVEGLEACLPPFTLLNGSVRRLQLTNRKSSACTARLKLISLLCVASWSRSLYEAIFVLLQADKYTWCT